MKSVFVGSGVEEVECLGTGVAVMQALSVSSA